MKTPVLGFGCIVVSGCLHAANGLVPPAADILWPQWRARVAVQATGLSPRAAGIALDGAESRRDVRGAAVIGDYYFSARPDGGFRVSGGLITGLRGGVPLAIVGAGPRLGMTVHSALHNGDSDAADTPSTVPYFGLGFTGSPWRNGPSLTADLGLVAERGLDHPGGIVRSGRGVLGNQGLDRAVREMRLSPVLQLGLQQAF